VTLRRLGIGLFAAALVASGCGGSKVPDPRPTVAGVLAGLAAGDVAAVCGALGPRAVAELAVDFGGASCAGTVATATRYVSRRAGERAAVAAARVLPAMDLPLSPAPYHAGDRTARVRISFHDPVLGQDQLFDVTVARAGRGWQISSGIDALFTLLPAD
jgi:hypothetical protein